MNSLQTFQINSPSVIFEIFDDEIVIIDLERGTYYSVDQSGSEVWQLLQQGANCPEIVARLAATYAVTPREIESPVQQFLTELIQEQLIVSKSATTIPYTNGRDMAVVRISAGNQRHFTPPSLNKYTDMQDLLLLDPIHDVVEAGWPNAKSR